MAEHMTVPKLAQRLGISDNTVRRYTKNYSQFFKSEMIDGWEQYPVGETLKLVSRIGEISAAGKRRSDVIRELEQEFQVVQPEQEDIDVEQVGESVAGGRIEFGPQSMAVLNRIAEALEIIARNTEGKIKS